MSQRRPVQHVRRTSGLACTAEEPQPLSRVQAEVRSGGMPEAGRCDGMMMRMSCRSQEVGTGSMPHDNRVMVAADWN